LKPDIDPLRRRSKRTDRARAAFSRKVRRGALPCETDQAKPDRISRLARSTNLSKILEGDSPGRDPLDRGPGLASGFVLELDCAMSDFRRFLSRLRRFGANFSKLSKPWFRVKQRIASNPSRKLSSRCAKYQRAASKNCPSR